MATTPALRISLLHLITFLGSLVFAIAHLMHYVGALAEGLEHAGHDHGHSHLDSLVGLADGNGAMMWMVVAFYLVGLVAPVAAALSGRRAALIVALVVGGLFALLNVVDGVLHAVGDGAMPLLVSALIGVGVPGTIAATATVRALRSTTPTSVVDR